MRTSVCLSLSLPHTRTHARTPTYNSFMSIFFLRATRCPRRKLLKAGPETGSMPPPESLFFLRLLLSTSPLLCHSTSAYFLQIHFLIGAAARRCCCAQKHRGLCRAEHTHRNGGSGVEIGSVRLQLLRSKGQTRHCLYVHQ